jgi:AraC-like DNA-binding protein
MHVVALPRTPHSLHVMPTSAGYEIRQGGAYDWHGLRRGATPFTILQYTISGHGMLRIGSREHVVEPGTAMVLTVPDDHRYWLPEGGRWEFFWMSMSGAEAVRLQGLVQAAAGPLFRPERATVDQLAGICGDLIGGKGDTPARCSALGYGAMMALFDAVFGADDADAQRHPAVSRAVALIEADPGRPMAVGDLAAIVGLSRAHFSRLFAEVKGIAPAEFQLRSRLRLAARLISTEPGLPIKAAAARAGFADANYFAKAFRRIYGVSPGEFRASGMYFDQARPR